MNIWEQDVPIFSRPYLLRLAGGGAVDVLLGVRDVVTEDCDVGRLRPPP